MVLDAESLNGKVLAVTGATSGIGAATVRSLVKAGARVVAASRRAPRLQALVAELGADVVVGVPADVRRPDACGEVVRTARERFGQLDGIVVSAGIGAYGGILDLSDDLVAEMMDVNYGGTVWAVRAAVPALLDAGGGDIVIVASVAGLRGGANEAIYAGTKAAQVALAGALDRELRPSGIRVSALCPAAVDTEFALGRGRTADDPWLKTVLQPEDVADAVMTVLQQPRHMRTTQWSMWAMSEPS